jgi:hypothetical protein
VRLPEGNHLNNHKIGLQNLPSQPRPRNQQVKILRLNPPEQIGVVLQINLALKVRSQHLRSQLRIEHRKKPNQRRVSQILKASLEMMASEQVSLMMVHQHRDVHPDHEARTVRGGNLRLDLLAQKTTAFRRLRVSKSAARREAKIAIKREARKEARKEAKREAKMRLTSRVNHAVAVEAGVVAVAVDGVLISILRKKVVLKPVLKTVKIFLATVGILMESDMKGKGRRPLSQPQRVSHRLRRKVISGKSWMPMLRATRENSMLMVVMIVGRHRMMIVRRVAVVVAVDAVDERKMV